MPESKLDLLRSEIDTIDNTIVELLEKRMTIVKDIGNEKKGKNLNIYHPEREESIFKRLFSLNNSSDFPQRSLEIIYREIMSVSRNLQRPMKIAYLGPKATYTHMAVLKHFGSVVEPNSVDSITDVFKAVETGKVDYGVVPVENSTEGIVTHTIDQFINSPLQIVSEIFMKISHCLLSTAKDIKSIKKLYSHPQSLSQCRNWIRENLKKVEINETSSNAKAASIASWDKYGAAIAGKIAANVYNLNILSQNIEDNPVNITRFLVIGKECSKPTNNDKTSIVCSVKDKPGALHDLLSAFSEKKINMTKIESRPTRKKAWEYLFYIDIDGHKDNENIKTALANLESSTHFLKILGSYPIGRFIEN